MIESGIETMDNHVNRLGISVNKLKRAQRCTLALSQSGGCEKSGVKQYPSLGLS